MFEGNFNILYEGINPCGYYVAGDGVFYFFVFDQGSSYCRTVIK